MNSQDCTQFSLRFHRISERNQKAKRAIDKSPSQHPKIHRRKYNYCFFEKIDKKCKKKCAKKIKKLWFWHPPYFFTFFFQNDAPDAKTRGNPLTFKKWILSQEGAENHEKRPQNKCSFSHKNQYTNIWFFKMKKKKRQQNLEKL